MTASSPWIIRQCWRRVGPILLEIDEATDRSRGYSWGAGLIPEGQTEPMIDDIAAGYAPTVEEAQRDAEAWLREFARDVTP